MRRRPYQNEASFNNRIAELLAREGAQTFRISKATFSRAASVEVIEQIAIRGDLAVEALAD